MHATSATLVGTAVSKANVVQLSRSFRQGLICCLLLSAPFSQADAVDSVFGDWVGPDSILRVEPTPDAPNGGLAATIIALLQPHYGPEETEVGIEGAPRRDDNHPDEALRSRLVLGINLLSEYKHTGKRWEGKIYDPASGNVYSSRMTRDGDTLKMRGYIGAPLFGRTAEFQRLDGCTDQVRQMLARSDVAHDENCRIPQTP